MRWQLNLMLGLLIGLIMTGCGPAVSNKDMGTVIYEIPHVQGADEPYKMPQINTPAPEVVTPDSQEAGSAEAQQPEAAESKQVIPDNRPIPMPTPARK
jgi:hypothetical protein